MRRRSLVEASGKVFATACDGAVLRLVSGRSTREKVLATAADAVSLAQKEEWARLKKGFVLVDDEASPGQPRLHRYVASRYTGAMIVAQADGSLITNECHDEGGESSVVFVDREGQVIDRVAVSLWRACYSPQAGMLVGLTDAGVVSYVPRTRALTWLARWNPAPVGVLSVEAGLAVWYDAPCLVVTDLRTGAVVRRQEVDPEIYGGHTRVLAAALSGDGATLAWSVRRGELHCMRLADGSVETMAAPFQMFVEMGWAGPWLFALERYGTWGLWRFRSGAPPPREPEVKGRDGFSFMAVDGARVALSQRSRVRVLDAETCEVVGELEAEHVVRSCAVGLHGEALAVRTDYGCLSLYAL